MDDLFRITQERQNQDRCGNPGDERRDRCTCDAHLQAEDQDRVSDQIDAVHEQCGKHRRPRVAHRPEQSRTCVIQCNKRDRSSHDHQIGRTAAHHVCFDFSEYDIQDKGAEEIRQRHNQNRENGGEQDQLLGCFLCDIRPPATEILAADDRTSGRERGKQVDQKDKYIVNERYSRDSCLTGARDHHRVSGADRNG